MDARREPADDAAREPQPPVARRLWIAAAVLSVPLVLAVGFAPLALLASHSAALMIVLLLVGLGPLLLAALTKVRLAERGRQTVVVVPAVYVAAAALVDLGLLAVVAGVLAS